MIVRPLTSIGSVPDAGMLLGGTGNQEIINKINNRWANSGVVFGSENDPFAERFAMFNRTVVNVARDTAHLLEETHSFMVDRAVIIPLKEEEDLAHIPACMHVPLLTYPPIRDFYDKEAIFGWGVEPECLPDDDEHGRLINNGYIGPDSITGKVPDTYEWHWKSGDPDLSMIELQDLLISRQFVTNYIAEQLQGDLNDPTGYIDGMKIDKMMMR